MQPLGIGFLALSGATGEAVVWYAGEARRRRFKRKTSGAYCIFAAARPLRRRKNTAHSCSLFFETRHGLKATCSPLSERCNGGTSDQDLVAASWSRLDPEPSADQHQKGIGLMKAVNRQFPALSEMFERSVVSTTDARRLGMVPPKGMTYQELGIANIPGRYASMRGNACGEAGRSCLFQRAGSIFQATATLHFIGSPTPRSKRARSHRCPGSLHK